MRRAYSLIRSSPHYRADAFRSGLVRAGFHVTEDWPQQGRPGDVLVIWNRYYDFAEAANRFEKQGGTVLVAENGYLGVEFNGSRWYALARGFHNGAGEWPIGDRSRWDELGVELAPWRTDGREILLLPQRGIGPRGVAMPDGWEYATVESLARQTSRPVRIRAHPGQNRPDVSLEQDLRDVWAVVTWGSGAALKALVAGVPVFYAFPKWIGRMAAAPLERANFHTPCRGDRLPMFRALAWAMWRVEELATGEPFRRLTAHVTDEKAQGLARGV